MEVTLDLIFPDPPPVSDPLIRCGPTGSNKTPNRPRLVDFDDVTNVLLDGFGLLNAA